MNPEFRSTRQTLARSLSGAYHDVDPSEPVEPMTHEKFIDAMLSLASGVQKYEKALAALEERERKYREALEARDE